MLFTFINAAAAGLAVLVAVPIATLLIEVLAASASWNNRAASPVSALPIGVAVLVPAHNESEGLKPTLAEIGSQLKNGDRLVVIADNCTDDTATLAAAGGAEVVERHDLVRIGKGFALDAGVRHLGANPPDVVIIIDADCHPAAGTIERLAITCAASGRPVQALDLMVSSERASLNHNVAEFAWRLKNWVRPLGLAQLGLPCQLMGTGMALPWSVIKDANLATGHIVEDMRLGLELSAANCAPLFCPEAMVTSEFPVSAQGAATQRQRWEHGHLQLIRDAGLPMLWLAFKGRNLGLAALVLDMLVPPLALLLLISAAILSLSVAAALVSGALLPLACAGTAFAGLIFAVVLAWARCGRDVLPFSSMLRIVPYLGGKLLLYLKLLRHGPNLRWIRADRGDSDRGPR
jgi:cellulose synthase/poly-beta-1,6-N-acetylglucosamine synthase-like glycosyltransferase